MGVKYNREYSQIIEDLSRALEPIEGLYDFLYMEKEDWYALSQEEKLECISTLSDDVIFALGQESVASVGSGSVEYDEKRHILKVVDGPKVTIVNLY